jgi:dihydroneopterin aldolase
MTPGPKPAVIRLEGLSFYAYHGNSAAEKEVGQRFEVDCELGYDIGKAAASDSLVDTIDYTKVYSLIESIMLDNKFNLIETLADRIADDILHAFPVAWLVIRVRKMTPPIAGNIECFEVETERIR